LTMRVWSKQEGLPDNSVTAVLQTRDGYLWVATSAGLVRFDGARFVPIHSVSEKTNEIIRVTALCEDATGRLWIGTQGKGLFHFSGDRLTPYHAGQNLLDDTINSIAEDAAGNLWLGMPSGLNLLEEGGRLKQFTTKDGLPNDFVSNVHVARSGTVWITTRGGMCQFKNGLIFPYPFQTDSPGRNPESLGVYEDRSGNLWAFGDTTSSILQKENTSTILAVATIFHPCASGACARTATASCGSEPAAKAYTASPMINFLPSACATAD
jgi:ligand-binding sensor domain-containing protein